MNTCLFDLSVIRYKSYPKNETPMTLRLGFCRFCLFKVTSSFFILFTFSYHLTFSFLLLRPSFFSFISISFRIEKQCISYTNIINNIYTYNFNLSKRMSETKNKLLHLHIYIVYIFYLYSVNLTRNRKR